MFKSGIKESNLDAPLGVPPKSESWGKIDIMPRQRTDDVEVTWK